LAFGRAIFMMVIFFVGPGLDGGGVILDGMARLGPAFILFAAGFFDTSNFCFLMAAWGHQSQEWGRERTTPPFVQELSSNDYHSECWPIRGHHIPSARSSLVLSQPPSLSLLRHDWRV
jgi:hypothetical protein